MAYTWEHIIIEGKQVHIASCGEARVIVYMAIFHQAAERLEHLTTYIEQGDPQAKMMLVVYEVEDWNRDLSPWQAPSPMGDAGFAGEGSVTAAWLHEQLMPYIREHYDTAAMQQVIAGYSLSGLFALWQFYESRAFDGVACCSGSLWFEGWTDYVSGKKEPEGTCVYLSLGGKEEKTKNPVVAKIGELTRWQSKLVEKDPHVKASKYELNSGGHFADAEKRLSKGMLWLYDKLKA